VRVAWNYPTVERRLADFDQLNALWLCALPGIIRRSNGGWRILTNSMRYA